MNKKGAIELSMTTIIVIIMGVVLLSLGLMWIRTVFGDISGISDDAFDKANTIIGKLENVDSLLTIIPEEIEIDQNKDNVVKIVVANLENEPITVKLSASTTDSKLNCGFPSGDKLIQLTDQVTLNSGDQKDYALIVKDSKGSLRTTECKIKVEGQVIDPNTEKSLIIRVEKSKSMFG